MGKYGTNLEGFGGFEGGVNADKGAPLVSTSSDGETALLFGPAALREIQAGVANGDFAIPPDAAGDTITAENPLPYWTFTDTSSAGAITAAIIADAGAGSGNVLRFTVASGTLTGKSATLTRYIPVASSASRSFAFYAEATFESGTSSTQATATLSCQFYKADLVTTTGSSFSSGAYAFNDLVSATGITAPNIWAVAPDLTPATAPADAGYLKITITIATVATQSAARTIDLTEVRVAHGLPELIITDKEDPSTYPPAIINANLGELNVQSGSGDYLLLRPDTLLIAADTVGITAGSGDMTLTSGDNVILTAPNGVYATTNGTTEGSIYTANVISAGDLRLLADGGDVYLNSTAAGVGPRLLFRDSAGTFYGGLRMEGANVFRFYNGSTTNDYAYIYAERIYPMNGTTASRYLYDDGTNTATSGNLFVGNFPTTAAAANLRSSSTAGSQLLVSTSSRRWKENIEDIDAETLAAAKRLKARHFDSLHEADNHKHLLGLIAEEVDEAGLHCAVNYDDDGLPFALDWSAITTALLARLEDAERRIAELESR